jgi:hypothetical protein
MAWAYPNDHHREWALNREPKFLDSSSIGASASMLRPFVVDEIGARLLTAAPDLFGAELISNLIEGYKLVASMEIRLHRFVLQKLKDEYGDEEWWTKGVPRPKRKACSDRCEEDDNRYDRWLYFNLLDLQSIIENRWSVFGSYAERLENFPGKKQFLKHFETMNTLRNQIMHPLKGKPLGQDDFEDLHRFSHMVDRFVLELQVDIVSVVPRRA